MINNYLKFTEFSESPQAYHKWTYLSMVSGIVGKKCWINFNYFTVYPNLYIILVSLPGEGKKSTALRIGHKMVQDSDAEVIVTMDSLTPQALMIELEESYRIFTTPNNKTFGSSSMTLFSSELVTLLGGGAGMVEFLTDIYDSAKSWEYKTKNKGKLTIKSPCLNVISCVTTEVFSSKIIRDAVAGGFISRSIIIYANDQKAISPFCMPSQEALEARQRVVDNFSKIKDIYGEVSFTPEAKQFFETWYMKTFAKTGNAKAKNEFNSRKHTHVAKAAMLLAISDLTTVIDVKHLVEAIGMLDEVEHYMKLIQMSAGASRYAETQLKILSTVNDYGKVSEEDILTLFVGDMTLVDFTEQIELMLRAGFITLVMDENQKSFIEITPKGKELFLNYTI